MPIKTKEINEITIESTQKKLRKANIRTSDLIEKSSKVTTHNYKNSVRSSGKNSTTISSNKKHITSNSTKTRKTSTKMTDKKNSKIVENHSIIEYYDLPYRYNKTIIKVLAQTPTTLFVYWDISDEDKAKFIKEYGNYFFYDTKPVLLIYNTTLNYKYEIDINDYANSWYIHVPDANCNYEIKLGRRPINNYSKIKDYLEITSSNNISSPNDHILFENLTNNVYFRNVKSNITTKKDFSVSFLTKIGKKHNTQDFYQNLYKNEVFSFDKIDLKNLPSS